MPEAVRMRCAVAALTALSTVVLLGLGPQTSASAAPAATHTGSTGTRSVGTDQAAAPHVAAHPAVKPAASGAEAAKQRTARALNPHGAVPARRNCPKAVKPGFATCLSLVRTDVAAHKGITPNDTPAGFEPADLTAAYNLPAGGGSAAETIGIVDAYDDVNAEADLAIYRQQYGLPACTTANGCFEKVGQDGTGNYPSPPPPGDDWTAEISLDVDMASAICPQCHMLLVEADDNSFDNLGASVDEAVVLGAQYVSNSYGGAEDPSQAADTHFKHPGVVITASSGDGGYGVEYPAASPYVTSVGGTSLTRDSSPRGWSETVWNNAYGAPGSGCSANQPKPSFQTDTGCARRTVADVSADADPATGVATYDTANGNSGWAVFGGTSASAPMIAGAYAVAGKPGASDYPNSYPYGTPSALNDVTEGNDGTCSPAYLCTAGTGYDGPTGLGTPNGTLAFRPAGRTVTSPAP